MNRWQNTQQRYGTLAVLLHWLIALGLVALVALGLYMVQMPDAGFDKKKVTLVLLHKEAGIALLCLAALRLGWRLGSVMPRLVDSLPDWQKVAARFVHLCFYALMFALPISGWLMSSAAGIPVSLLGLFLPDLIAPSEFLFRAFIAICFVGHAGAALAHHFVLRDDTLKKMLPGASG
jgi:cytochrome b561